MLRRQQESNRRDLLVLVHRHLLAEGLAETAAVMRNEVSAAWNSDLLEDVEVCDNVDLELVLMDFQNFYQMRFHRKPKLTRRAATTTVAGTTTSSSRAASRRGKGKCNASGDTATSNNGTSYAMDAKENFPAASDDHLQRPRDELDGGGITIPRGLLVNADTRDLG